MYSYKEFFFKVTVYDGVLLVYQGQISHRPSSLKSWIYFIIYSLLVSDEGFFPGLGTTDFSLCPPMARCKCLQPPGHRPVTSCLIGSIRLAIKHTKNGMSLNHPETIPPPHGGPPPLLVPKWLGTTGQVQRKRYLGSLACKRISFLLD